MFDGKNRWRLFSEWRNKVFFKAWGRMRRGECVGTNRWTSCPTKPRHEGGVTAPVLGMPWYSTGTPSEMVWRKGWVFLLLFPPSFSLVSFFHSFRSFPCLFSFLFIFRPSLLSFIDTFSSFYTIFLLFSIPSVFSSFHLFTLSWGKLKLFPTVFPFLPSLLSSFYEVFPSFFPCFQ